MLMQCKWKGPRRGPYNGSINTTLRVEFQASPLTNQNKRAGKWDFHRHHTQCLIRQESWNARRAYCCQSAVYFCGKAQESFKRKEHSV